MPGPNPTNRPRTPRTCKDCLKTDLTSLSCPNSKCLKKDAPFLIVNVDQKEKLGKVFVLCNLTRSRSNGNETKVTTIELTDVIAAPTVGLSL